MSEKTLLSGLVDRQQDAVTHTSGPLLILAGAGTGKTTTITVKIAYMVQELGIDPGQILALTFSRAAAANMRAQVDKLLNGTSEVQISTFHSFCAGVIRANADKCGVHQDFSILEDVDTAVMLHRDVGVGTRDALLYTSSISKAKDLNITIEMLDEFAGQKKEELLPLEPDCDRWEEIFRENATSINTFHLLDKPGQKAQKNDKKRWTDFNNLYLEYARYRDFVQAWTEYENRKRQRNALDYGDLNTKALQFLNAYGAGQSTDMHKYIIIDEFQDTNYVQFELIKQLSGNNRNVTVVADPNQTIYAFRGAYTNNIQAFTKYFNIQQDDIVALRVSFRSTDKILDVSHKLIMHNYMDGDADDAGTAGDEGLCVQLSNFEGAEGENVNIAECVDEDEEARYIVERIEAYLESGMNRSDIAVLYRTHAQGRKIRQALEQKGHSIRVKDDTDFLKQPEIKTALSYLYVLDNVAHPKARGTEGWWRLFHYNHALNTADSIRIGEHIKKHRITFPDAIYNNLDHLNLSTEGVQIIQQMRDRIDRLKEKLALNVSDTVLEILDASGLSRQFTLNNTKRSREAMMNLRNLHEMAERFEATHGKDLGEFIAYLEILDEMGKNPASARIITDDAISLMTIHASKGMEFKVVLIVTMAKDKFPLSRGGVEPLIPVELMEHYHDIFEQDHGSKAKLAAAIRERKQKIKLEEERRLCYVAMTRAREHLWLTLATQYNGGERQPSRFLEEIGYDNWRATDTSRLDMPNITYIHDEQIKSMENVQDSELEQEKRRRKQLITESLDAGSIGESLGHLMAYHALRDGDGSGGGGDGSGIGIGGGGNPDNEPDYFKIITHNHTELNPCPHVKEIIRRNNNNTRMPAPTKITFSVTSINTYLNCPKMYELQNVLNMPTRTMENTTGAMNLGSFVHRVLEKAVKTKVESREQLDTVVSELSGEPEWKDVDPERVKPMIDVFWERNKNSIRNNLMVEQKFTVPLGGHLFKGSIDRVDLIQGADNEVEIIDYKTGGEPGPNERSRQLLLYAHGFKHQHPEYTVRKLSLELLSKPKPRVYELNNAEYVSSRVAPLDTGVLEEMADTAEKILQDCQHGFKRTDNESECEGCGYRLYCG
ncbi:MAG: ATP-dependent helicase [Methanosarcinales archaeon]|nr:MAG: ATP-dependent helicase [Methanosarcinales archaeon]